MVLCPSNTFMATPLFGSCAPAPALSLSTESDDLCMSFADFVAKADDTGPRAAFVVHIGGHIAFEIEQIAQLLPRSRASS